MPLNKAKLQKLQQQVEVTRIGGKVCVSCLLIVLKDVCIMCFCRSSSALAHTLLIKVYCDVNVTVWIIKDRCGVPVDP